MQPPIVFIVDEDAETRNFMRELAEAAGLAVQTYADAAAFLDELAPEVPGCLIIGTRVRSMAPLELQRELGARAIATPVVFVAASADVSTTAAALKAGAMDVIEHPLLPQRIIPLLLRAIAADLTARARHLEGHDLRARYAQLTAREREVLELVIKGQTSVVIAQRLGLRPKTVEIYRSHINRKMRAHNAVELVTAMSRMG